MLTDGVIFDLDGTLWDSCRVVAESWGETLRRLDPAAVCPARGGELYPELEETLAALSAREPLFIVSNCLDGYIQCFLHSSGLGRYFRDYECEGSTGLSKAENIMLLCRRHGLRRPVYVGDTRSDESSARKAGCAFIHAAYGFGSCEAPDAVIRGLGELPGLLKTGEGEKHV